MFLTLKSLQTEKKQLFIIKHTCAYKPLQPKEQFSDRTRFFIYIRKYLFLIALKGKPPLKKKIDTLHNGFRCNTKDFEGNEATPYNTIMVNTFHNKLSKPIKCEP